MSKRNAIIIIAAILLIIIGALFFYFRSANTGSGTKPSTTSSANPFGAAPTDKTSSGTNGNGSTSGSGTNQSGTAANKNNAKLVQLYADPISGSIFVSTTSQDLLEFVDRGNGNVYKYLPQSQSVQPIRLTDTTIPKIEEAVWSATGNALVYRYLDNDSDTIDSFSGAITSASTTGDLSEINGGFLSQDLAELVADPAGDKLFGLLEKSDGSGSDGILSNFDGSGAKEIFTSPASFWNISWPASSIIAFNTKPTYKDYGYLYFFNPQTDSFQRILGDIAGLSTLTNSDGSFVAYSQSTESSFDLGIYNVKNKSDIGVNIATLADKCVWSIENKDVLYCAVPQSIPTDNYPDAWYQGIESFSDNIWMIHADTGVTTEIYQVGVNETASIDAEDLAISPDDKYLAFENKDDLSLWLLATGQ